MISNSVDIRFFWRNAVVSFLALVALGELIVLILRPRWRWAAVLPNTVAWAYFAFLVGTALAIIPVLKLDSWVNVPLAIGGVVWIALFVGFPTYLLVDWALKVEG